MGATKIPRTALNGTNAGPELNTTRIAQLGYISALTFVDAIGQKMSNVNSRQIVERV